MGKINFIITRFNGTRNMENMKLETTNYLQNDKYFHWLDGCGYDICPKTINLFFTGTYPAIVTDEDETNIKRFLCQILRFRIFQHYIIM